MSGVLYLEVRRWGPSQVSGPGENATPATTFSRNCEVDSPACRARPQPRIQEWKDRLERHRAMDATRRRSLSVSALANCKQKRRKSLHLDTHRRLVHCYAPFRLLPGSSRTVRSPALFIGRTTSSASNSPFHARYQCVAMRRDGTGTPVDSAELRFIVCFSSNEAVFYFRRDRACFTAAGSSPSTCRTSSRSIHIGNMASYVCCQAQNLPTLIPWRSNQNPTQATKKHRRV